MIVGISSFLENSWIKGTIRRPISVILCFSGVHNRHYPAPSWDDDWR